jgi:uncharacterized membrane protein YphA (DoxX/SURF4 family)
MTSRDGNIDGGLLVLRLGVGANGLLLFVLKQAQQPALFTPHPGRIWLLGALAFGSALITLGFLTRFTALCMTLIWAWTLYSGLSAGEPFFLFPVRDVLFMILLAAVGFAGAGRFSVDHVVESSRVRAPG